MDVSWPERKEDAEDTVEHGYNGYRNSCPSKSERSPKDFGLRRCQAFVQHDSSGQKEWWEVGSDEEGNEGLERFAGADVDQG